MAILERALDDPERGLGGAGADGRPPTRSALIARLADGDARRALNVLELAVAEPGARPRLTEAAIREAAQRKALLYDKAGEEHYNLISALHKSLRDSDPDGALYWLGRMLDAGEDPLYVARRLVRFASEDVGNADPAALRLTLDAKEAYHFLGTPEGELALAQATCYLALAPKSNAVYAAWNEVREDIQRAARRARAAAPPQRATGLMAQPRLRPRLPVRARRARRPGGPGASARRAPRARATTVPPTAAPSATSAERLRQWRE